MQVNARDDALTITTPAAEFHVLPSGYIQSALLAQGERLSLDEPDRPTTDDFPLDPGHPQISAPQWKLGTAGKRIELTGASKEVPGLDQSLALEVYDDFPNVVFSALAYKNAGRAPIRLSRVVAQAHRLNAAKVDGAVKPDSMWSFQGASFDWGQDTILKLAPGFSRPNVMGAISHSGAGGGIPVVAFWTARAGLAIGHIETKPLVLSMPVRVDQDQRIEAAITIDDAGTLNPGERYTTPRTFTAVYSGDFYEPLRLYSQVLQREGWQPATTNEGDYAANWCGWGYRSDVTLKQMLDTIPKLKEFNIHWATLDYRWFNNFGDWQPRSATFPDHSTEALVRQFHQEGIKVQVWWLPLAVSDGQLWEPIGPEEKTPAARADQRRLSDILKVHPDWLILDEHGKPPRLFMNRAALCPALPEVQNYYRDVTTRLIGEWGFDGSKLDMCFTVPACYNPAHHHKSPQESILAMPEIFKIIEESSRKLKPDSITQICPCGALPNFAWLPYEDQAVTADPVGAAQVRQRIKMYKALLGPQAAVYGDHVELTAMKRTGNDYREFGQDFASTVGTGGVVGTKFTWPDYGPTFKDVYLTPQKEVAWKKWIDLYNSHLLSKGAFLNLYVYGYDVPEGYAISKDGKMYYAFFAPDPSKPWSGQIELRGLAPGKYRVLDYEKGTDLGQVDAANPKLSTSFEQHLLLEVTKL